jgi:thiol:disulfide interchange protein DsbD
LWRQENMRQFRQYCVLRALLSFGVLALGCLTSPAAASEAPVRLEAMGPHTDAQTNRRFVAARLTLADGWHVYWRNPGDSGQAPHLAFTPANAAESPVWPCPSRLDTPPLASYGYGQELILPAPLLRDDVDVSATVHWLACAETCVPGTGELHWSKEQLSRPSTDPQMAAALASVPALWPSDWLLDASRDANTLTLEVRSQSLGTISAATFYPDAAGGLDENQPKHWSQKPGSIVLRCALGRAYEKLATSIDGVLELTDASGHKRAFGVHSPLQVKAAAALTPSGTVQAQASSRASLALNSPLYTLSSLAQSIVLACMGGILLNAMPCVFPVLSMKVLGYINTSGHQRTQRRRQALWYALGNVLALTAIGAVLLGLRAMGQSVGWGFQMQSPVFVMAMAQLMFVMGLAQLGLVRFGERLMGLGQGHIKGQSHVAAFLTGVLTIVVATPCSAPFMGVATAAALAAPDGQGLAIFAAIGLGVALPYLALCYIEPLARRLPRPGAWMVRLREASGLCLWGSCIWLLWIVGRQCGLNAMTAGLVGCLALGSAAWLHHTQSHSLLPRSVAALTAAFGLCAAFLPCYYSSKPNVAQSSMLPDATSSAQDWQPYSEARLAALRAAHTPVFVDFTAAWCVSCQLNEVLVLNTSAADALLARYNVARLKADWTDQNAEITQALAQLGRSSVPLYVFYTADAAKEPVVLPAVLTYSALKRAIEQTPGT